MTIRRRDFLTGAAALGAYAGLREAEALSPQQLLLAPLGGVGWINPGGPGADLDFANNRYFGGSLASLVSVARASPATTYAQNAAGVWLPFAANTPRITNLGFFKEPGATNIVLQSTLQGGGAGAPPTSWANFGTSFAPIASVYGAPGSAYQFTSAAALNFLKQTVSVSANTTYTFSVIVEANPGGIPIQQLLTALSLPSGGAASFPQGGATIPAAGSRIYIQCVISATPGTMALRFGAGASGSVTGSATLSAPQCEIGAPSSIIPTTTAPVARSADNITLINALATLLGAAVGSLGVATNAMLAATTGTLVDANGSILLGKTSSDTLTDNITSGLSTANTGVWTGPTKSFISWSASGRSLSLNNGTPATDAAAMTPSSAFHLGSLSGTSAFDNGFTTRLTAWGSVVPASFFKVAIQPAAIFEWGDSLTAGNQDGSGVTYPNALSALYSPARTSTNEGNGGDTSSQVLTRFQALPASWNFPSCFWVGRNGPTNGAQIQADIATMVADLTTKEYVVLSIINDENEPSGNSTYNSIVSLNAALASTYGANYLDVRSMLIAAYNPANGCDVLDHANDIPPFSLRAIDLAGTVAAIGPTDTSFATTPSGSAVVVGTIMTIGTEYIKVVAVSGNNITSCTRGYGGTVAGTYANGTAYVGTDILHLGAAGYRLIAQWVYAKIQALGGW